MALSDKTNVLVKPYTRTQYPVLDEGISSRVGHHPFYLLLEPAGFA